MEVIDQTQLAAWLALLGGPGYKGRDAQQQAVAEMRAVGANVLFPLLIPLLTQDEESRCQACKAILQIDAEQGLELVLPLLHDPAVNVRWFACGCVAWFGGAQVVPILWTVLQSDEDAQVRGIAASGLGWQGGPEVIPMLLEVMFSDHEFDLQGHSPSYAAALALDDMFGTDEMDLHWDTLSRMRDKEPDVGRLRHLVEERCQQLLASRG